MMLYTVCVHALRRTLSGEYKSTCTCVQYIHVCMYIFLCYLVIMDINMLMVLLAHV